MGVAILLGGGQGRLRDGPPLAVLKASTPTRELGGRRRVGPITPETVAVALAVIGPPGLPMPARATEKRVDEDTEGAAAATKVGQHETVTGETPQTGSVLLGPTTEPRRKGVVKPEAFPTRMATGASRARGGVEVVATAAGLATPRVAGLAPQPIGVRIATDEVDAVEAAILNGRTTARCP